MQFKQAQPGLTGVACPNLRLTDAVDVCDNHRQRGGTTRTSLSLGVYLHFPLMLYADPPRYYTYADYAD